jgi:hypothetical protein
MSEIYLAVSQEYEKDLLRVKEEISTFEDIYKTKTHSQENRQMTKGILKKLYKEKDDYARKAKFYRTLYQRAKIGK